ETIFTTPSPTAFPLLYHGDKPAERDIRETNHARRNLPRRTQIATDGISRPDAGAARRRGRDQSLGHVRQRPEVLSRLGWRRLARTRQGVAPGDRRPRAVRRG